MKRIFIKYIAAFRFIHLGICLIPVVSCVKRYPMPSYVVYDMHDPSDSTVTRPSAPLVFPLSADDRRDVAIIEARFDSEENMAGLAAPQIGIAKQIIVFAAPPDPLIKKWRPDFTQTMPKTIWINPSYEGIEEEGMHTDYEGCFSVKDMAGAVPRYKKIHYQAYDLGGNRVEGTAEGFFARIIQHEIDHINGILYIARTRPEGILPIETFRQKRRTATEGN